MCVRVWACTKATEPACVLSRSRFLTLVSLLRAEPAMTSASADTPAITMAPHKDISGRGWGGEWGGVGVGGHRSWHIYGRGPRSPSSVMPSSPIFFSFSGSVCTAALSVYRIFKRASQPRLAWPGLTLSLIASYLLFLCRPLSLFEIKKNKKTTLFLRLSILDPPLSLFVSNGIMDLRAKCLLKKWPPTGLCLTLHPDGQKACVCMRQTEREEKQMGRCVAGSGEAHSNVTLFERMQI